MRVPSLASATEWSLRIKPGCKKAIQGKHIPCQVPSPRWHVLTMPDVSRGSWSAGSASLLVAEATGPSMGPRFQMMKTWEVPQLARSWSLGAPRLVEAGYPGAILCPPDTPLPSSFLRTATIVVGRSVSAVCRRAASIDRAYASRAHHLPRLHLAELTLLYSDAAGARRLLFELQLLLIQKDPAAVSRIWTALFMCLPSKWRCGPGVCLFWI